MYRNPGPDRASAPSPQTRKSRMPLVVAAAALFGAGLVWLVLRACVALITLD